MEERRELSELHKRFLQEYALNGGNGTQAYIAVRPNNKPESAASAANHILKRPEAQEYLKELQEDIRNSKVADLQECLELLTGYIRDSNLAPAIKMKAADMRLKTMGAYLDRKEIKSDVVINVDIDDE